MTARYVLWNMHGPTVYQTDDRDEAYAMLARKWGTNAGVYRLLHDGLEIARLQTNCG